MNGIGKKIVLAARSCFFVLFCAGWCTQQNAVIIIVFGFLAAIVHVDFSFFHIFVAFRPKVCSASIDIEQQQMGPLQKYYKFGDVIAAAIFSCNIMKCLFVFWAH